MFTMTPQNKLLAMTRSHTLILTEFHTHLIAQSVEVVTCSRGFLTDVYKTGMVGFGTQSDALNPVCVT